MCRGYIALGGNLGDVAATFTEALSRLDAHAQIEVRAKSSNYRTAAVGEHAGDEFVNAAAELATTLQPLELLDELQTAEDALGRTRELHWGPRTLDLDLIQYDQLVIDSPKLILPHPHGWYRRFVLDPVVEIAPQLNHPSFQRTYRELREQLLVRPLPIHVTGLPPSQMSEVETLIGTEFSDAKFSRSTSHESGLNILFEQPAKTPTDLLVIDMSQASDYLQSVRDVLLSAL